MDAELYRAAWPFPHVVMDRMVEPGLAVLAAEEFPHEAHSAWRRFDNRLERKLACDDPVHFGPTTRAIVGDLHSVPFCRALSELTGIDHLTPSLYGGGMHMITPGGFLAIHTDFNRWAGLYRRVNLLVFCNDGWEEEWGGHLELCSADGTKQLAVSPQAGRGVVFSTSDESFHGHPTPLACPSDRARRSIAMYYFSPEPPPGYSSDHDTVFMGELA